MAKPARGEKACPQCAEHIKAEAKVCRFCGHGFSEDELAASRARSVDANVGRVMAIGIVAIIFLIVMLHSTESPPGTGASSNAAETPSADNATSPAAKPDVPRSSWSYSKETDQLRGTSKVFASIVSDNAVEFEFPYGGGSHLTTTVRRDHHGNNIIFRISSGQFTCGIESCSGAIRLDGTKQRLLLVPPADGSSDALFAEGEAGLIAKLKKAKHIIVELPFYQSGNRQFDFTTAIPLHWPPTADDLGGSK